MSDLRWAARFAFVDELWRGRTRIVVDASLERWLAHARPGGDAAEELAAELLPHEVGGHPQVWMVVENATTATRLAASRPGTNFATLDRVGELVSKVRWEVLLLDAGKLGANEGPEALAARLSALRIAVRPGATIVLHAPVREDGEAGGLDYAELSDVVAALGGGRVFGLYTPAMAAVVDFGERVPARRGGRLLLARGSAESFDDAETIPFELPEVETVADEEDDDVPLTYDNSLGSQEPDLVEFVALIGDEALTGAVAEGMSLIELPAGARDDGAGIAPIRRQLERVELERQQQLERAERLARENAALSERCARLEAEAGRSEDDGAAPRRVQEELEAALAREQTLRWRVGQLEREVAALLARPVDVWEAENAALQARLAELEAERGEPVDAAEEAAEPPADAVDPTNGSGPAGEPARSPMPRGRTPGSGATAGGQHAKAQRAVLKVVEGLVRRIERGGIGTLQLRRELVQLRRRLQA